MAKKNIVDILFKRATKRQVNSDFTDSAILNDRTTKDYLERMTKICLSIFEWVNLPDSMDSRFLEETLFYDGQASFLYDQDYGYINTRCSTDGYLNIYELPTNLRCFSTYYHTDRKLFTGLVNKENDDKQAILVMNNWDRLPTFTTIQLFAYRLAMAQRTCDVNILAQRTPVVLSGTDKQKLTLENIYLKYDGNQPVIIGDSDILSWDSLKAIRSDAPYVADKITEYKKEIWNEFLTYIGVNNIDVQKKERLITGESNANNEVINLNLQSYLAPRKKACEQFNKLFNTNIDVRVRSDLFNVIKQEESVITDYNKNGIEDTIEEGVING